MVKTVIPWYVKIPAKIVLSRLPIAPLTWQRLNLFRAGVMDNEESARSIFLKHLNTAGLFDLTGKTVLELGPGNGLLTGKLAAELGASKTWLIDAAPLAEPASFPNTEYLSNGLPSLRTVPTASVDFLFSNAVLEHIRLKELPATIAEMKRVLKPDGVASHQIDFRDHLGGALNNLRFSADTWESDFMAKSGFYTNRVPWPQMAGMMAAAGFSLNVIHQDCWPSLPTSPKSMAEPFQHMKPQELLTWGCHVLLKPARTQ
jgi:ubiquinone/menaquinone biosynthesis C-methylase UbiE